MNKSANKKSFSTEWNLTKSQFCASHIFDPDYHYHSRVRNYTGYDNYKSGIRRITHCRNCQIANKFYLTGCCETSECMSTYV